MFTINSSVGEGESWVMWSYRVELSGGVRGWSENGVIWTVEMKCGVWSGEEIERWSKKKIKENKGKTKKT